MKSFILILYLPRAYQNVSGIDPARMLDYCSRQMLSAAKQTMKRMLKMDHGGNVLKSLGQKE